MNTNTCNPRSRKRTNGFFVPSFENIINELMHTNVSDIVTHKNIKYTSPAVNVQQTEDKFVLEMALPGMSKKEVSLNIENDILTIASVKEIDKDIKYRLREFNYGTFERKFRLSDKIDQSSIAAKFTNGVLIITLLKKPEQAPKTVTIK